MRKRSIVAIAISLTLFLININSALADLNDGLVAYYPFNGNANDESGNFNDGTIHGSSLIADRFGVADSAYDFDGVDDFISVVDNDMIELPNVKTLFVWFKFKKKDGDPNRTIISRYQSDNFTQNGYIIISDQLADNNKDLWMLVKDSWGNGSAPPKAEFTTEEWQSVCLVVENNSVKGYLNGQYLGTGQEIASLPDSLENQNSLLIGAGSAPGVPQYNFFCGSIDDIRIYNRPLLESEIEELHNQGSGSEDGQGSDSEDGQGCFIGIISAF